MARQEDETYRKFILEVFKNIGQTEADDSLKKPFSNIIDSRRTYFAIRTCQDLVKTLEERDEISEQDVSLLKYIISHIISSSKEPSSILTKTYELVISYEKLNKPETEALVCAICEAPNPRPILVEPVSSHRTTTTLESPDFFSDVWEAINEIESDLAGAHWLKLARSLGVKEGYLEELQYSNQPHSEKVVSMFKKWIETKADEASVDKLIEALDLKKVGRKDLSMRLKKKFNK